MTRAITLACLVVALTFWLAAPPFASLIQADSVEQVYTTGTRTRDGTGKYFMGREIAQVMGHLGAGWLDRKSRVREERTDLLIDSLPLEPDSIVLDLGAGTGHFSIPMAQRVPRGRVIAADLQPEMLSIIRKRTAELSIDNIETLLASEQDPGLERNDIDLVLIVDAYHEFSYPLQVMQSVSESLSETGLVYLIEYRAEDPRVPIKPLHKMSEPQAIAELKLAGLEWVETLDFLPQQHVLVFRRQVDVGI